MKSPFTILPSAKPLYGEPCNGCGWCCNEQLCRISKSLLPRQPRDSPCPFLVSGRGRYQCGVYLACKRAKLTHFAKWIRLQLDFGGGCRVRITDADEKQWENLVDHYHRRDGRNLRKLLRLTSDLVTDEMQAIRELL